MRARILIFTGRSCNVESFEGLPVKLSICIPTYNFGQFIGETLESIVTQLEPEVEIVILDGGSTDDTEEVVKGFVTRHPAIKYVRQQFRGGIDRDMARVVDLARGDYCWLFSSDDIMRPGAMRRVLVEIASGMDIYLGGMTLCDRGMATIEEHPVLGSPWGSVFNLADTEERQRYFECAQTTVALFSFMGVIVIKRDRWQAHKLDEAYVGSCWAHVVRILGMMPDGLSVKYLGESLLRKRSDNDSFMDRGIVHRYAIAINGYNRIAGDIFGEDSLEARHIRRILADEFPPKFFLSAKLDCIRSGRLLDIKALNRLVQTTYRDRSLRNCLYLVTYRLLPARLYQLAKVVYKSMRLVLRRA